MRLPTVAVGSLLAPVAFTFVSFTLACGSSAPEKGVIDGFFRAARARDNVTLGGIAIVAFDPNQEGIVESYTVMAVGREQTTPLHLKQLAAAHQAAASRDREYSKKMKAYQDANADAVKRVLEAERTNRKPAGRDAAIQAEWNRWRDNQKASSKEVAAATEAMASERGLADVSINNPAFAVTFNEPPVDPTLHEGTIVTKDYTISATVQTPSNEHVKRTLVVTLQKVVLKGEKGARHLVGRPEGRWIITRIRDATPGAAL